MSVRYADYASVPIDIHHPSMTLALVREVDPVRPPPRRLALPYAEHCTMPIQFLPCFLWANGFASPCRTASLNFAFQNVVCHLPSEKMGTGEQGWKLESGSIVAKVHAVAGIIFLCGVLNFGPVPRISNETCNVVWKYKTPRMRRRLIST
jgi:hypothetical protein